MTTPAPDLSNFVAGFYLALDEGDVETVAASFAPDGLWLRKGEELVGPDAVKSALSTRDPSRRTAHIVSNFTASAAGSDSWTTHYYLTVYDNKGPEGTRRVAILACTDTISVTDHHFHIRRKQSRKHL